MSQLPLPPSSIFDRCNETELYQVCRKAGLNVQPGTPKQDMLAFLSGREVPPQREHELDSTRMGLIGFLLDYWPVVRSQVSCPAKDLEAEVDHTLAAKPGWEERVSSRTRPLACFTCVDTQVLSCLVQNQTNRSAIQLKRKPVPTSEDSMTQIPTATVLPTIDNAPRTLEGLQALKRFNLRRLMDSMNAFTNEREVSAFQTASLPEQAQAVLTFLQAHDARQKGAAPAAPAEAAKPRGRQPANGGAPAPANAGAPAPAPTAAPSSPAGTAGLDAATQQRLVAIEQSLVTIMKNLTALQASQEEILATQHVQQAFTRAQLGFLSLFGEQVLGAPRDEILKAALADGQALIDTLGKG